MCRAENIAPLELVPVWSCVAISAITAQTKSKATERVLGGQDAPTWNGALNTAGGRTRIREQQQEESSTKLDKGEHTYYERARTAAKGEGSEEGKKQRKATTNS